MYKAVLDTVDIVAVKKARAASATPLAAASSSSELCCCAVPQRGGGASPARGLCQGAHAACVDPRSCLVQDLIDQSAALP